MISKEMNLEEFIAKSSWLKKLATKHFGLMLPNGWFGQPWGEWHSLKNVVAKGTTIIINFDCASQIEITKPRTIEISPVNEKWSYLKIVDCEEVIFTYGRSGSRDPSESEIKKFTQAEGNDVTIVGYFPLTPEDKIKYLHKF